MIWLSNQELATVALFPLNGCFVSLVIPSDETRSFRFNLSDRLMPSLKRNSAPVVLSALTNRLNTPVVGVLLGTDYQIGFHRVPNSSRPVDQLAAGWRLFPVYWARNERG